MKVQRSHFYAQVKKAIGLTPLALALVSFTFVACARKPGKDAKIAELAKPVAEQKTQVQLTAQQAAFVANLEQQVPGFKWNDAANVRLASRFQGASLNLTRTGEGENKKVTADLNLLLKDEASEIVASGDIKKESFSTIELSEGLSEEQFKVEVKCLSDACETAVALVTETSAAQIDASAFQRTDYDVVASNTDAPEAAPTPAESPAPAESPTPAPTPEESPTPAPAESPAPEIEIDPAPSASPAPAASPAPTSTDTEQPAPGAKTTRQMVLIFDKVEGLTDQQKQERASQIEEGKNMHVVYVSASNANDPYSSNSLRKSAKAARDARVAAVRAVVAPAAAAPRN